MHCKLLYFKNLYSENASSIDLHIPERDSIQQELFLSYSLKRTLFSFSKALERINILPVTVVTFDLSLTLSLMQWININSITTGVWRFYRQK